MKYSDFIKGNKEFQSSINIQYDLNNLKKIDGYIPTSDTVKILKDYLYSLFDDNINRATVLVGPYGKGKSHLLLVLLTIMMCDKNNEHILSLINKISEIDPECSKLAKDALNNKKYLPIIINFNSEDLNQAFLVAINHALKEIGAEDILPNTYFEAALNVLKGWENYSSTINKFKKLVKEKCNLTYTKIKNKLKDFDNEAYSIFKDVFFDMTSGIEFNPMINTDVVKMIEEINYKLKEQYNYDGIIIVFDEFSKFIESSEDSNNTKDLKILQDIAELSGRSKKPQLHLVCITHKTINEYISRIPEEKIDAWKTIEGRFTEKYFISSSQQNYELIANAINKTKKFDDYYSKHEEEIKKLTENATELFMYEYDDYLKNIVKGCFPLSPYTTYCLPIVSEKVAQNERTLFTYLSKNEENSLLGKVAENKGELNFIKLDSLYDYFEPLFKKETFNDLIHEIYLKVNGALKIAFYDIDKEIIKTLGIIYIINDFNSLAPNIHTLSNILGYSKEKIQDEVEKLVHEDNILIKKRSTDFIDFMPTSTVKINSKIKEISEIKYSEPNVSKILSDIVGLKYILPKRYNDEYKMIRYFKRVFMTVNELSAYSSSEQILSEYNSDGIILDIICLSKEEIEQAKYSLNYLNDNRILIVIPKKIYNIAKDLSEYEAINELLNDVELIKEDNRVKEQLDFLKEDLEAKVFKYIDNNYNLSSNNCKLYSIENKSYTNLTSNKLSELLSKICKCNFNKTPVINNELINKNKISSPVLKARDSIVNLILNNEFLDFDYNKSALECTLFRATLVNTNIIYNEKNIDENLLGVLDKIKEFLISAENKNLSFKNLYFSLQGLKDGIGMRKGIIPIFIAWIFKEYKDEIIIYRKSGRSKKEVLLDCNTINKINEKPEDYEIKVEKGTEEKRRYLKSLKNLFKDYMPKHSFGNKFIDITKAMQLWYQSLSLFSKNHTKKIDINVDYKDFVDIDDKLINFKKELLKFDLNSRQFIFEKIPKILQNSSCDKCINDLKYYKNYLEKRDKNVKKYLIDKTVKMLDVNYEGTFIGTLNCWYSKLNTEKIKHLYDGTTNNFLEFLHDTGTDDIKAIEKIAFIFTKLAIEDWNDDTFHIYFSNLNDTIEKINNYKVPKGEDSKNEIKIIFNTENKEKIEKTFNEIEISTNGKLLLNELEDAFDEFSDSIDDNEKRNILINLLKQYM